MVTISLIIPVYNAEETLPRQIASINKQTLPSSDYEVIYVNDGSTDNTPHIISNYPDFTLINQNNHGPGAARNRGSDQATSNIIVYTDADCILPSDFLASHLILHKRHPELYGLCGGISPGTPLPFFSSILADHLSNWFYYHKDLPEHIPEYLPGANMSIKRRVLDQGVSWPNKRITGEDVAFSKKMQDKNMPIKFFPKPVIHHIDRASLKGLLQHQFNWGFHAPFIRGESKSSKYSFLFPANCLQAYMLSPLIVLGYTMLLTKSWLPYMPVKFLSSLPLIILGKIWYARGVLQGTKALVLQKINIIADQR